MESQSLGRNTRADFPFLIDLLKKREQIIVDVHTKVIFGQNNPTQVGVLVMIYLTKTK